MPSSEPHVRYAEEIIEHCSKLKLDHGFQETVRTFIVSKKISSFEDFDWHMAEEIRQMDSYLQKQRAALSSKYPSSGVEPKHSALSFMASDVVGAAKLRESIFNRLKPELANWKKLSLSLRKDEEE